MKRCIIDCDLVYQVQNNSHFVFQIEAAECEGHTLVAEELVIDPPLQIDSRWRDHVGNRFFRLDSAAGTFSVRYRATVDIEPPRQDTSAQELSINHLPDDVLHFLVPTRYCESDLLGHAAQRLFGNTPPGYQRVEAICQWIRENIEYRVGTTTSTTTARDVFVGRFGVCRDFAHLGITLSRALNIPARFVVGYVEFEEPPPDYHAIFEVYLGGKWVMFDPTGLAPVDSLVRVGTGQDAKDVPFATIFGPANMLSMNPNVQTVDPKTGNHIGIANPNAGGVLPQQIMQAA